MDKATLDALKMTAKDLDKRIQGLPQAIPVQEQKLQNAMKEQSKKLLEAMEAVPYATN